MANYYAYTRTNYFKVKDEQKFKELMEDLTTDEVDLDLWDKTKNGETFYAFGGSGCLAYNCGEVDEFYEKLQELIPEGEAVLVTEVGHEKLCYLEGYCTIITSDSIECVSLQEAALQKTRELLRDNKYEVDFNY